MSTISVRPATEGDANTIRDFQQAMAMETEGLSLDLSTVTMGVKAVFSDSKKGRYWVAESGGQVIASLLMTYEWSDWRNAAIWWFQSVYVLPPFRRKGVFKMMYEHIRQDALRAGAAGLRLYVEAGNTRAQLTYEAMGMNGSHYKTYEWLRD